VTSVKPQIVAEIEGEYGPLTVTEELVQKIWARGDFRRTDLQTQEGADLEILDLGNWNRLAGPDFKNVRIRVDGHLLNGDAELHFFESDWTAHGHEGDPAFANVILHILVFPSKSGKRAVGCSVKHSFLFLDALPQSLENYAEEEVLGALAAGEETALEDWLLAIPTPERLKYLVEAAEKRWHAKVKYAARRISMLGWEEACHHTGLEILGYRYNRAAMLFIAGDYSLKALRDGDFSAGDLYRAGEGRWRLSGTRPANQPFQRLVQYETWVKKKPFWPDNLSACVSWFSEWGDRSVTDTSRKLLEISNLRAHISENVVANSVGGTRIENLICDGLFPLLAAKTGIPLFAHWFHWFPGDVPSALKTLLKTTLGEADPKLPLCNGSIQGALQRMIEIRGSELRK
jgi:hypothetical protein